MFKIEKKLIFDKIHSFLLEILSKNQKCSENKLTYLNYSNNQCDAIAQIESDSVKSNDYKKTNNRS